MDNIKFYSQIEMKVPPTENNHIITREYLEEVLKDYIPDSGQVGDIIIVDKDGNEIPLKKYLKFLDATVSSEDEESITIAMEGSTGSTILDTVNNEFKQKKYLKFLNAIISEGEDVIVVEMKQPQINLSTIQETFEFSGDGTTTEFTFDHNFGTRNITYSLYDFDTGTDVSIKFIRINDNQAKVITTVPFEDGKKFIITISKLDKDITEVVTYKEWGIRIDTTDSNPASAVKYIETLDPPPDDFGERPCLFKDGKVNYYLDPSNFYRKINGFSSDIISGNDGDVMIEIPKMAFYIENIGNFTEIRLTNHPNATSLDPRFRYLAHSRDVEGDREKIYVGAYQGCEISGKLRSLSGKNPLNNNTITLFRTKAQANGAGYTLTHFHMATLLQIMYIMKYGNLNSQAVLGQGVTTGTAHINTGGTETSGMYYGTQNTREHVKFAGIEDFYGNLWDRIDGSFVSTDYTLSTATTNFNDTGAGYKVRGKWLTTNIAGTYLIKPHGDTEKGFLPPNNTGGSSSTHYCDYIYYYNTSPGCVGGFFGGGYGRGASAGAFALHLSDVASHSHAAFGARLLFA